MVSGSGTSPTEHKNYVSGRKDIEYNHCWILFIPQLNSKEENPLQAQIPFLSRGRGRNPHLSSSSLPQERPSGTPVLCWRPAAEMLSGLETPDHSQ